MNEDHYQQLYLTMRKLIPPPNPIFDKTLQEPTSILSSHRSLQSQQKGDSDEEEDFLVGLPTLDRAYSKKALIFDKWPWRNNTRKGRTYFSSVFVLRGGTKQLKEAIQGKGATRATDIVFDSCYEGGNLMSVYRVADQEYDLILQNDINTGGYTQWFDFTLSNATTKGTFKLNIVNLYKRQSLFGNGLKPLTRSLVYEKGWKRGCHGVEYFNSQALMQGRKGKHYRVLSFKYDFIFEQDCVRFCYCLPYGYSDLTLFLSSLHSEKVRVKHLGATPLGKIITMLQVGETRQRYKQKKAVFLMGRQHPGETPSSHILQSILEELTLSTQQNDFLLSRYNFYIIPMVNVDGVVLGNYRCTFQGFDPNRCWNQQDPLKHPEVCLVKNELRRIMKHEQIQLLIDFHGHSTKMNSFFYGNNFGKNNMLFPCIAARNEPFITLSDCSFSEEDGDRAGTARVVLGNMIKETGSVYTFEVSLFGGIRNGKKVAFGAEHYQGLARNLLAAVYKTGIELHKEEKLLKQSTYLKDIRKEMKRFEGRTRNNESGSDDEARKTSQIEEKIKISPQRTRRKEEKEKQQEETLTLCYEQETQTDFQFSAQEYREQGKLQASNERKPNTQKKKLSFSIRKMGGGGGGGGGGEHTSRKMELMNKLRVFGETFAPESPFFEPAARMTRVSAETQTVLVFIRERQNGLGVTERGEKQQNRSGFIGAHFLGWRLGEPRIRRDRIRKSHSTRVTQADGSLGDIIRHNKLGFY